MSDTWHEKCLVSSFHIEKSKSGENLVEGETKREIKKERKKERDRERGKGRRPAASPSDLRSSNGRNSSD